MRAGLRIIRSMSLDSAGRTASSLNLIRSNTSDTDGSPGATPRMRAFRGPTPRAFGGWDKLERVAALSVSLAGLLASHSISAAQPPLPVSVERDGDTFYVRARASVAVDPRIAWDTLTDYEHMPDFLPNVERSRDDRAQWYAPDRGAHRTVSALLFRHSGTGAPRRCAAAVRAHRRALRARRNRWRAADISLFFGSLRPDSHYA